VEMEFSYVMSFSCQPKHVTATNSWEEVSAGVVYSLSAHPHHYSYTFRFINRSLLWIVYGGRSQVL